MNEGIGPNWGFSMKGEAPFTILNNFKDDGQKAVVALMQYTHVLKFDFSLLSLALPLSCL